MYNVLYFYRFLIDQNDKCTLFEKTVLNFRTLHFLYKRIPENVILSLMINKK